MCSDIKATSAIQPRVASRKNARQFENERHHAARVSTAPNTAVQTRPLPQQPRLRRVAESSFRCDNSLRHEALQATRPTLHGASRLVQSNGVMVGENPACSVPAL